MAVKPELLSGNAWKIIAVGTLVAAVAVFVAYRYHSGPRGSYIPVDARDRLAAVDKAFGKDAAAGCAELAGALPFVKSGIEARGDAAQDKWRAAALPHLPALDAALAQCAKDPVAAKAAFATASAALRVDALRPRPPLALLVLGGAGFVALAIWQARKLMS